MFEQFSQQIEEWRDRVAALLQRTDSKTIGQHELLKAAFEELHVATEELHVAFEQMQQQNEQLRATQAAVQWERQRYQELFEEAQDGYLFTDTEGTIQQANRAAATLLNIAQEFLVGQPLIAFIAQQERQSFQSQLTMPRVGDWVREWEVRLQPSGRKLVNAILTVAAVRDSSRKLVGLRWLLHDITDRKRVELALRSSEERFRLLVESAYDYAIFTMDPNGYVTSWNKGAERILGYKEAEIIGQHGSCIYTLEDRTKGVPEQELRTAAKEGRAVDERWHIRKDDTRFWASGIVTPLRDEAGCLQGFSKIMRDMTEPKQAELALQESEQQYRRLVELSPDTVFVQSEGKFILVNQAGAKLLNASDPTELAGKAILDFVHPDSREIVKERIQKLEAENIDLPLIEEKWLRLDGTVIDVEVAATSFSYKGKPAAQVVVRDITERKLAQAALQQLNVNLKWQVSERTAQLQQAVLFESVLKRISDKVRDSLDPSQILHTAMQELTLVLGVSCCNTALYNLETGTSTICYEYAIESPNAQARNIQITAFPEIYQQLLKGESCQFCSITPNPVRGRVAMLACPIFDDQGVLGDLWLIAQSDHTFNELEIRLVQQVATQCAIAIRQARLYQAAKAQVEELERLNRLKDDFLNTVSHELRTPMASIKMATSMLEVTLKQAGFLDARPNRAAQYLQILRKECEREIGLINDLLDLSRLEAGDKLLCLTTLDLTAWIPPIVNSFAERTRNQQQSLEFNIPTDLPTLTTDEALLERILIELLHNACKYTPASERIRVTATAASNELQMQVSNSGVEIPQSELSRIFDKFYRISNNDPWKHGGTGLGLALVKKLVEHLGGTIQATASSGWTTFTIELPLCPS